MQWAAIFGHDVWILGERERFGPYLEILNYENILTENLRIYSS